MEEHRVKPQIKWTEEKISILKEEYPYGDTKKLKEKLGLYSMNSLKDAARRFGIKRLKDPKRYKLEKLADFNNLISLYWLGFIVADGNICEKGILRISSSIKDMDHLNKFRDFLGIQDRKLRLFRLKTPFSNNLDGHEYCSLSCTDTFYGKEIVSKLDIAKRSKTYYPPNLDFLDSPSKLLAFFIGFFDGDGCLDFDYNGTVSSLKIEIHSNWKETLQSIADGLTRNGIDSKITLSSRGYAQLRINKNKSKIKIKQFASANNLPFLPRKLGMIDENKILAKDIFQDNLEEIISMRQSGLSCPQIATKFNLRAELIYKKLKKLGIKPKNFC